MPATLYRGDARTPYEIFTHGFRSRGNNNNLRLHVEGDRAHNSNYISTTGTRAEAIPFARSQGGVNLSAAARTHCAQLQAAYNARRGFLSRYFPAVCPSRQWVSAESYIYDIDARYARNALYVPDQFRGDANFANRYAHQDEWAYVHRIPREAIRGVHVYRMTGRTTTGDLMALETVTFTEDRYIINGSYGTAPVIYNPGNDTGANFSYNSDLNTPPSCEPVHRRLYLLQPL